MITSVEQRRGIVTIVTALFYRRYDTYRAP